DVAMKVTEMSSKTGRARRKGTSAAEVGRRMSAEGSGPIGSPIAVDPFSETIAYQDAVRPEDGDGFPLSDDLVERGLGQYRMLEVIGRGTMGRVYRAEHSGLGRTCAIKVMNPGLIDRQPQIVERFRAEARAVAALVHPNIVTVHNLGSDRGYHYIEM